MSAAFDATRLRAKMERLEAARSEDAEIIRGAVSLCERLIRDINHLQVQLNRQTHALYVYSNPQNWSIHREGDLFPRAVWIGPYSDQENPQPMRTAEEGLGRPF